ncbi:MAG: hypothetical protein HRT61_07600 [Ekhidna sp.]|nr:hypothetical protein [Ekhidna sp.]
MPYDLTQLNEYLSVDTNPAEVAQLLRYAKYALVRCAERLDSYEGLGDRYLGLLLLEDEFLRLDDHLSEIQMRWK